MLFDLSQPIQNYDIVAFDTETSGAYPIEAEVIELGAVKYRNGQIVDKFQTLIKPRNKLTPENIRIHGITNEMLVDASSMATEVIKFGHFVDNSILLAHHAPFDLGFMAIAIEKNELHFPNTFNLCSSLISRALLNTTNHKLQTLIKELNLIGGDAHRAFDDAYACLQVLHKCLEKLDAPITLDKILQIQKKDLHWKHYSVFKSSDEKIKKIAEAAENNLVLHIIYEGGQTKSKPRAIRPFGLVRNPDGDYIHAECCLDLQRKRFYLNKIKEVKF